MSYTVCQPDLRRDRASILELWKRNLPTASEDRYAWLYETGRATGWLLKSAEGAVVGAAGLMGRTMNVSGGLLPAGQAIDLNVDKKHRTIGPALGLGRAVTATVKQHQRGLIYAFPDPKSELVLRRVGYKVLGSLGRWAKPLRCEGPLKGWLRHTLPRKAAAVTVDSLLHLTSPEAFYRRPADVRVHVTDHFDARFDALWQTAARQFHVVGERTSAYLTWRFCQCPEVRHRVFCLSNADHELLAYLVYSCRAGTVHIGDFLFANSRNLDLLLVEFLQLMRRQEVEAIITVYLGSSMVCRKLEKYGFWKRPSEWKTLVYVDQRQLGSDLNRVLDEESWHLTRADVDTDDRAD